MNNFVPAFNYNFLTPLYDPILNFIGFGDKERSKISRLLSLKENEQLLDVGCGTGSLLKVAKKMYPKSRMTGIDIDSQILKIAEEKFKKDELDIKLINASASKLPFKNESFEVIVSTLIFHHLPYQIKKQALKEIRRVLKREGRFLLVDFGGNSILMKMLYHIEATIGLPEAKSMKDNVEGKIPILLNEVGFNFKEVASRYLGIQYILASK